jgi:hypothetical protein
MLGPVYLGAVADHSQVVVTQQPAMLGHQQARACQIAKKRLGQINETVLFFRFKRSRPKRAHVLVFGGIAEPSHRGPAGAAAANGLEHALEGRARIAAHVQVRLGVRRKQVHRVVRGA